MKLSVQDNRLYAGDNLLLCIYDAGDCDTIPWPLDPTDHYWTEAKWNDALNSALFDAREMGYIPDCESVELPNDTKFYIS